MIRLRYVDSQIALRAYRLVRLVAALALCSGFLVACGFEHVPHRLGEQSGVHSPEYDLRFVEADDEGWFWDPSQAVAALSLIEESVRTNDTIVVLYVHGWHHSSACCDGNVEGFKEVLHRLRPELQKPMYVEARRRAHPKSDVPDAIRVIGIYVGWRGRSLPSFLDYSTFWGRKAAAERVGHADLQEFMIRMQQVYDRHYAAPKAGNPVAKPFLGIVSIGHSFGGQVMLNATSWFFENELQQVNPTPGYLRSDSAAKRGPSLSAPLRGFGDLVILVNPAVEAAAYQRVHALAQGVRYSPFQTPVLLTISADNDAPRHSLFEFGRIAGEFFTAAPHKDDVREREMKRQALGVYGPDGVQVTHRLEPTDLSMRLELTQLSNSHESFCSAERQCSFDWYSWVKQPSKVTPDTLDSSELTEALAKRVATFDFSKEVVFGDVVLKPGPKAIDYQAMIVASAHPGVIDGHNGMYSEPFMNFLIRYIGFTEAKKYLLAAQRNNLMSTVAK